MKRVLLLSLFAALLAGPALAQGEVPDSCKPRVAGVALALADEADAAQLQCDVDRAAILAKRADAVFGPFLTTPLLRIVDTTSGSGAAYVYGVIDVQGAMLLDVRTVPADMSEAASRVPVCHLRTMMPDAVARQVSIALLETASPDIPGYAERMEVVINPDGSRRSVLLLDSHDVITTVQTASGERNFSRNIRQTDKVAKLNELIIGVANVSDGWDCNAP